MQSLARVPFSVAGALAGCLCFDTIEEARWSDEILPLCDGPPPVKMRKLGMR